MGINCKVDSAFPEGRMVIKIEEYFRIFDTDHPTKFSFVVFRFVGVWIYKKMFFVTISLLVFEISYTNYVIFIECLNKLHLILAQNSVYNQPMHMLFVFYVMCNKTKRNHFFFSHHIGIIILMFVYYVFRKDVCSYFI